MVSKTKGFQLATLGLLWAETLTICDFGRDFSVVNGNPNMFCSVMNLFSHNHCRQQNMIFDDELCHSEVTFKEEAFVGGRHRHLNNLSLVVSMQVLAGGRQISQVLIMLCIDTISE